MRGAAGLAAAIVTGLLAGAAQAACGLCASAVTTNTSLAACFLDRFDDYAARDGEAVAVDLEDCEAERGVVEALAGPTGSQTDPDLRFILSKAQLACFRERIEDPGIDLDPSAVIRLDDCE